MTKISSLAAVVEAILSVGPAGPFGGNAGILPRLPKSTAPKKPASKVRKSPTARRPKPDAYGEAAHTAAQAKRDRKNAKRVALRGGPGA